MTTTPSALPSVDDQATTTDQQRWMPPNDSRDRDRLPILRGQPPNDGQRFMIPALLPLSPLWWSRLLVTPSDGAHDRASLYRRVSRRRR